jgi:choline-sulfatase
MIVTGAGVPVGKVSKTPVSLVDAYPTIMDCIGEPMTAAEGDLPGGSLWDLANSADDDERVVFSEYHAAGAMTGAFMIRRGRYKFVYYVGLPPQLFDHETDPEEQVDLAEQAEHAGLVREFEAVLRSICDPEAVDARAKSDQAALIERHGGLDAVNQRGSFGATPAPGDKPVYA